MLLLALFPRLWRRVMDPRVLDFYGGDVRLAALKPGAQPAVGDPAPRSRA